jgi:hypothetical protein
MSVARGLLLLCLLAVVACDTPFQVRRTVIAVDLAPGEAHLAAGDRLRFNATAWNENGARINGASGFVWVSSDTTVATVAADGTVAARRQGQARVTASLDRVGGSATITVAGPLDHACTQAPVLEVGGVATFRARDGNVVCLPGDTGGAEYTLVHFLGAATPTARTTLQVSIGGDAIHPTDGTLGAAVGGGLPPDPELSSDERAASLHLALRERERRELGPRLAAARSAVPPAAAAAANLPAPGALLSLNASAASACSSPDLRMAEVVAVTDRAIVVADLANPAGGFTPEEYAEIGREFDDVVYPVVTRHFGEPSDIDGNGRVILFFTAAVNAMGGDSPVGGFFFSRDLLPRAGSPAHLGCAASNEAELLYLMVPDPERVAERPWLERSRVRASAAARMAHEMQHLVNASNRLFRSRAGKWEEPWLNEGLSHIAEELVGTSGPELRWGTNVTFEAVRASPSAWDAFGRYHHANFARLSSFLEEAGGRSPFEVIDHPASRGAVWHLLRYAVDRHGGDQTTAWSELAHGPATGLRNLEAVLGVEANSLLRDWAINLYADDRFAGLDARWRQTSWNARSILEGMRPEAGFPVRAVPAWPGNDRHLEIAAGSAAYVGVAVPPNGTAEVRTAWREGLEPTPQLLISLIRTR